MINFPTIRGEQAFYESKKEPPSDISYILERIKTVYSSYFFRPDKKLVESLKNMKAVNLTPLLGHIFKEMVDGENIKDPVKFLDRLASLIPLENLLKNLQEAINVKDAIEKAKELLDKFFNYITDETPRKPENRVHDLVKFSLVPFYKRQKAVNAKNALAKAKNNFSKYISDHITEIKDAVEFSHKLESLVEPKEFLKAVNVVKAEELLNTFFQEIETNKIETIDPFKFLNSLINLVNPDKQQETVNVKDALKVENALEEAKSMFEQAKYYLQMTEGNTSPSIRARIASILNGIIAVIESIITAFGIADFFKPAESNIHADFKSQKIMTLLHLFSTITALLLPILGATTGSLIVGGTLLCISALSIIWRFVKPRTTHLPANAENWTKQIQNGECVAQGRKESINEIADIIKMNRHAILVGPSRVGKSLTAKAFAQAIERGDYPGLKGKVVFRINTADVVDQQASFLGGGNNILNKISSAMGRHRNDIILVLDEIHMACKDNAKIADQLKTFLDVAGAFPHVIGITTEEEYNNHVRNNSAFALRFDKVKIKSTDKDETLRILADTVLRSRSKPLIKDGALEHIYEKSCEDINHLQPEASLKLLKRCINRTEKTQKSPTEKKKVKNSNQIHALRSMAAASRGSVEQESGKNIANLKEERNKLKKSIDVEHKNIDKLFKSKELLDRVTKEIYTSVQKISTFTPNSENEKQLKIFLLLHGFLRKFWEFHIEDSAKKLKINLVIDKELIDKVCEEN